jgi:hypothetical protein
VFTKPGEGHYQKQLSQGVVYAFAVNGNEKEYAALDSTDEFKTLEKPQP